MSQMDQNTSPFDSSSFMIHGPSWLSAVKLSFSTTILTLLEATHLY